MLIRMILVLALAASVLALNSAPAQAQAETQTDDTSVETTPPPPPPKAPAKAGVFSQGRKRGGIYGGAGSTLGNTYFILGAGLGFFVLDGLEVGADVEGWLFQSPTIWKISPQVRYTVWQLGALKPYVGAFYRWTWINDDAYDTVNSYGGRAGLIYAKGRGFAGVGVVYERFEDSFSGDSDVWYPEISFSVFF
jgi:hypothetical protein